MKRAFCVFLLSMMVVGLFVTPTGYDITEEMIDHFGETLPDEYHYPDLEFPTINYFPSTEGTPHADSILQFYETTDDDVLFYPDAFYNDTAEVASTGAVDVGTQIYGTWEKTKSDLGDLWWIDSDANEESAGHLNFTVPDNCEGFKIATYGCHTLQDTPATANEVNIYNFTAAGWVDVGDIPRLDLDGPGWINYTSYDPDYWDSNLLRIQWHLDDNYDQIQIKWHYAEVTFYIMTLADSDHYAESFADVSDWTTSDCSMTTDDDVATITENGAGSWGRAYASFSATDYQNYYYEFRSTIESGASIRLQGYDGAAWFDIKSSTSSSGTLKGIISSSQAATTERVAFQIIGDGKYVKPDYLRIGPSDEMGWQHDCSTTEGFSYQASRPAIVFSSDNDVITCNPSGDDARVEIQIDTTATQAKVSESYYQFIEFSISSVTDGDADGAVWKLRIFESSTVYSVFLDTEWSVATGVFRYNLDALTIDGGGDLDEVEYFKFYLDDADDVLVLDYVQLFSIANFTISQSGGCTTSDVVYVDSGSLVFDRATTNWMDFNHDPALSVAVATHNVWNLTVSDTRPTSDNFYCCVGGNWESHDNGETRGSWDGTGTLTDFKYLNYGDLTLSAIKFWEDSTDPTMSDKWVNPPEPYDDESTTITVAATDSVDIYTVKLNAETYPPGFSDVDYTMTESVDNALYKYTFSGMTAGYYEFAINVNDGANTYTEYIPLTVRESEISVNSISLFGAGDDFDYMHWSFKINKDCSYVIREWSENVGASDTYSGNVAEGVRNIAWEKLPTEDTKVNFTVTFTNASLTYVFDSSYEVAQTALSVTSYDWGLSETQVTLSYQTTKSGTYTLYLDDVQDSTSSFASGSNFLNWSRPSAVDPTEICAAMKLTDGTTTIWLNQTYSEFLLTAFSIQTLFMDLTDPTVSAIFTTSWANATGYLYENDVQKDTQAEGVPLSYTKATAAGTYNVALKMDAGGEIAWYNTTYSVSAEDALSIVALVFDTSGLNVSVYVSTNWANTTVTIYENNVQKTTGSEGALSYVKAIASGDYSVGIKIDGTADSTWANFTYTIDTEASLSITSLNFGIGGSDVTAFATTNWMNATLTLFENDVQKDTGSEGTTLSYTKATAAGDYNIGLKIDAGADLIWANYTYTVSAEDTLSITALSFDTSGLNVSVYVNTNWANTTVTLYENDVQQVTGSEGSLSYLKATFAGDYNVSVKIDGTAATLWANYTYTVAAESALIINTLILDKSGPNITAFVSTNWGNCTITIYQNNVQKDSDSESVTLSYARSTAAGDYDIAIKIDGGASTLWHNDSYTIALEYSWQYIYVFDTGDPATYFPWESFDFYVNGSLVEKNEFYGRTDQGYRIAVVDKFGDTIYNATHSFDYTYRLSIAIYSFKVKCWVDGEVNVTITSSSGGVMNTWMGWGDLEPFYLFGSKTYQVKWFLDNSDKKVKGTGWHYYPALDWDGNQANPDPNWYGPVSASYLTLDDYGIGHLVGVVEDVDDGGGDGDANSTEIANLVFQSLAPLSVGVGAGFAVLFLILYVIYVAVKNIQATTGTTVIVEQPSPKKPPKLKSRTGGSRLKSGVRGRDQRGRHS